MYFTFMPGSHPGQQLCYTKVLVPFYIYIKVPIVTHILNNHYGNFCHVTGNCHAIRRRHKRVLPLIAVTKCSEKRSQKWPPKISKFVRYTRLTFSYLFRLLFYMSVHATITQQNVYNRISLLLSFTKPAQNSVKLMVTYASDRMENDLQYPK